MALDDLSVEDQEVLKDMLGGEDSPTWQNLKNGPGYSETLNRLKSGPLSKQTAQDIVDRATVPGKTAEEAAETLAPKQLPALRGETGLVPTEKGFTLSGKASSEELLSELVPNMSQESKSLILKEVAPTAEKMAAGAAGGPLGIAAQVAAGVADPTDTAGSNDNPQTLVGEAAGTTASSQEGNPDLIIRKPQQPQDFSSLSPYLDQGGSTEDPIAALRGLIGSPATQSSPTSDDQTSPSVPAGTSGGSDQSSPSSSSNTLAQLAAAQGQQQSSLQDQLADARKRQAALQIISGLGKAGTAIATGITGHRPDYSSFEGIDKDAASQIAQVTQNQEIQKYDPNSPLSKVYQQVLVDKFGIDPKLAAQITPAHSDTIMKLLEQDSVSKARLAQQKLLKQQYNDYKQSQNDYKQQKDDENMQAKLGKVIDAQTASSRSALGAAGQAKVSIDRVLALIDNPNFSPTPQDMNSVAADINRVVSNSSSLGGAEHQQYNTLASQWANLKTLVTSSSSSVNTPEIRQHIKQVALEMQKISNNIIDSHAQAAGASYSGWIKRHPDEWRNMVAQQSNAQRQSYQQQDQQQQEQQMPTTPQAPDRTTGFGPGPGPSKPKTVTQNGHTYTLNPQTGQYE